MADSSPYSGTFSAFLRQHSIDYKATFPVAHLVPRMAWRGTLNEDGMPDEGEWDRSANLAFREWINKCGENGAENGDRKLILDCCSKDLLFFINAFLWIKQEQPVPLDLPFITWAKQDQYVELITLRRRAAEADMRNVVRGDTLVDKPRQVGWSWINLAEGLQIVRFVPGATGIVGSRVEYDVDKPGASKTLFWKLDYFIEHLPDWFMPSEYWSKKGKPTPNKTYRSNLKLAIPGFGTVLGSATHENFGRSGQFAWMLLDEFAHTDRGQIGMGGSIWTGTTKNCRIRRVVSTPYGRNNKFCDLRFSEALPIFTVNWFDDPAKTVGAYRLKDDLVVGPVTLKAGDWWSPWAESNRKADNDDAKFAQEVLLSYEGTGGCFYEGLLPKIFHDQIKEPIWTGHIKMEPGSSGPRVSGIELSQEGFFCGWERWEDGFKWKPGQYVMAIDVASGSRDMGGRGASNSVVCVGRIEGKKLVKVAQYAVHALAPHLFAKVVCAIGWCFCGSKGQPAFAIWERNGPGETLGNCLMWECGYPNGCVYWETSANTNTARPGFQMNTNRRGDGKLVGSKVNVFYEHLRWLEVGDYQEPSYDTYTEMQQYVVVEDGGAEFAKRRRNVDPSGARDNHGDTVIGTVLMVWAARELLSLNSVYKIEEQPPQGSVAFYQKKLRRLASNAWR